MAKNSFVMYTNWLPMIEALDADSRSDLLLAIMKYQAGEELPPMTPTAEIAFLSMKSQFDDDREKYEETKKRRSEAGKIAAQARAIATNRNESLPIATNRNESLHDNVDVDVNDNVDVDVNDNVDVDVYVDDNVVLKNENQKKESDLKVTRERFVPPTIDEVREYAAEKGYAIDAEHFVDFYQSKGWMVGKNKMKDWKSAVRNWARQERQGKATKPSYMDAIADRVRMVDDW